MRAYAASSLNGLELCLKFTDTVDWRTSNHSVENLKNYSDLVDWSLRKGVIDDREAGKLLSLARSQPAIAQNTLNQARALREAIYTIFSAVANGKQADESEIELLNSHLVDAMTKMEVQITDEGYRLGWRSEEAADRMLHPLAKSAADLLTSDKLGRLRLCANTDDGCGSLFLDSSKSHSRRWCSMASCGNRTKVRTYYAKHKDSAAS